MQRTSIIDNLTDVFIEEKQFVPENGQPVDYKQLVLQFVVKGNVRELPLSLKSDKALILEFAQPVTETDFLDQTETPKK